MKSLLPTLIVLSFLSSTQVFAACPAKISGGYVGYGTKSELSPDTKSVTNISNGVLVVNFDNNSIKSTIREHVSADSTEGLQQGEPYSLSYKYDKATCTLRAWETTLGTSNSDFYFVVGNNGTVLYGVQGDVGDNESKLYVLTKQ